jgi:hypothetical protein
MDYLEDIIDISGMDNAADFAEMFSVEQQENVEQQRQSQRRRISPQRLSSQGPALYRPHKRKGKKKMHQECTEPVKERNRYSDWQKGLLLEAFEHYILFPLEWKGGKNSAKKINLCCRAGLTLSQVDKWLYAR